jgi:hypothetical protein
MSARRWNRMTSHERYYLLRQWYPDCWTINSLSLKRWAEIPAQFRYIISTNPGVSARFGATNMASIQYGFSKPARAK